MNDNFRVEDLRPLMTHDEIARLMTARGEPITRGGVFMAEKTALRKLRDAFKSEAIERGWISE